MPEIDPLTIDVVRKLVNNGDPPSKPKDWCFQHTGHESRIATLEVSSSKNATDIKSADNRINGMIGRLNVILGGIVVACLMLAINIAFNFFGVRH